ncbi:hypothetical protein C8F04DRAFT_1151540 [Mycena alexandri]|uniref:DUF6533 domain-containing protein n=1 Tax=Mycena alexandri TaxID=1745969 RepID=A0AAD6RZJ3_9AGAR|nr:hypothetical protein C8F04DRAFT_1151540 [Mycena alexandri]
MPGPALSYGPAHYFPDEAVAYVSLTLISNYVLYATATLLVYELFTSLDDEVARVWSLNWRLPKILFMLNRYVIRAILVCLWILADYPGTSPEFCRIYSYWQMIPLRLAILAAQALVVIRVWAIYNNSRRMFWILTILYTLEVVAMGVCVWVATYDTQGASQPAPLSCALNSRSGYLLKRFASGTWIAPVCFEFIMLIITLAKLVPRWRWGDEHGLLGSGGSATLDVLARDSLVYFGFIFTFSLTNAVIYELSFSAYYHSILLGPTSAISCIAVSRMMINIRSLPSSPLDHPTSTAAAYARPDLSFAAYPSELYEEGGIPDTAHTAYFTDTGGYFGSPDTPSSAYPHSTFRSLPRSTYRPILRPGSARTSGDATRVGDAESDSGSVIEMGLMKVL